jgi:hypothetical protein
MAHFFLLEIGLSVFFVGGKYEGADALPDLIGLVGVSTFNFEGDMLYNSMVWCIVDYLM